MEILMTAENNTPDPGAPDTIVLIHGLWVTPQSWEHWIEHYENTGYRVLAPAYPSLEVEVEALNEDPSPIEALTVPAVVEHYERIIGELDRPPMIMGHSPLLKVKLAVRKREGPATWNGGSNRLVRPSSPGRPASGSRPWCRTPATPPQLVSFRRS